MSLPLLRRGLRLPGLAVRPVRSVHSNPPQASLGPLEVVIGMCSFLGAFLVPPAYILANLDNYRKRE